jgi:hypothetical protein
MDGTTVMEGLIMVLAMDMEVMASTLSITAWEPL